MSSAVAPTRTACRSCNGTRLPCSGGTVLLCGKVLNEHIGLVARGIEQAVSARKVMNALASARTPPSSSSQRITLAGCSSRYTSSRSRRVSGEVTVDVAPLVVDGRLAGVFVELRAVLGAPGGETLLQLRASSLVAFLALGDQSSGAALSSHLPIIAQLQRCWPMPDRTSVRQSDHGRVQESLFFRR